MALNIIQGYSPSMPESIDSRFTQLTSGSRLGMPVYGVYEGLPAYQKDNDTIYVLVDAANPQLEVSWKTLAYTSGSFSGSFSGSGANLYDIPSSAITGLNLSQISSGSYSASISQYGGLYINTFLSASNLTGSNTGDQDLSYFATTGSNIFQGNQTITGSLYVSGSLTSPTISYLSSSKQDNLAFTVETNNKYLRDDNTFQAIETAVGGYANNLYFSELASDVSGYETLSYTPDSVIGNEIWTVASSEGEKLLKNYIYPSSVGVTSIASGVWSFTFYGSVNNSGGITQLGITYFARHLDNTETELFTTWSTEINNTTAQWFKFETTQPLFNVVATDRMGARVKIKTTSAATKTVTYTVGDGYGAYLNNPNKIRHTQLRDLNGDSNAQHMTAAEKIVLDNTSGINTGDQTKESLGLTNVVNQTQKAYHGVLSRPTVSPLPTNLTTTTFTLSALTTNIAYYNQGIYFNVTTNKTVVITNTVGLHWIYFVDAEGTLGSSTTFPGTDGSTVLIAAVYWNGTDYGIVWDERHSYNRDTAWHAWAHATIGTRYGSGLNFAFAGTTNADTTFTLSLGNIYDEDINFATLANTTTGRIWYQNSASTYTFEKVLSTKPYYAVSAVAAAGIYAVNSTGYVRVSTNNSNRYFNYFIFGSTTNNSIAHIFTETVTNANATGYTTVAAARTASVPNISAVGLSPEFKLLYRVVVNGAGLVQTMTTADDYRTTTSLAGGVAASTTASTVSETNYGNVQTAIDTLKLGGLETNATIAALITGATDQNTTAPADTDTIVLGKGSSFNKLSIANFVVWLKTILVPKERLINGVDLSADRDFRMKNEIESDTSNPNIIVDFSKTIYRAKRLGTVTMNPISVFNNLPIGTDVRRLKIENTSNSTYLAITISNNPIAQNGITYTFKLPATGFSLPALMTLALTMEFEEVTSTSTNIIVTANINSFV